MGSLIAIALIVLGGSGATYWLLKRRASSGTASATQSTPTLVNPSPTPPAASPALAVPPDLSPATAVPPSASPEPSSEPSPDISPGVSPDAIAAPLDLPTAPPSPESIAAPPDLPAVPPVSPAASPDPVAVSAPAPVLTEPATQPAIPPSTSVESTIAAAIQHSGRVGNVAFLQPYVHHRDGEVRTEVAIALGAIAARNPGAKAAAIVPMLAKLSQDANLTVRLAAVTALGKIRAKTVLPWLKQALHSHNPAVIKAATDALQRLKLDYAAKTAKPPQVIKQMANSGRK